MISIYNLKPQFQQLLQPVVHRLSRTGISANMVTLAATAASVSYGMAIVIWPQQEWLFLMLPVFMFFRMALNAMDGMLARLLEQQSKAGMLLNEVGDIVSDAALIAAFAILPGAQWPLITLTILLAVFTEFIGVLGLVLAGTRRYDGPMGKSDRACVLGAIGLLAGLQSPLAAYTNEAFAVMCALMLLSCWRRAKASLLPAQS